MARTGRPATGSIVWEDRATKMKPIGVRVTLADGSRDVIDFEPGTTPEQAELLRPVIVAKSRGALPAGTGETTSEWFTRWLAARAAKGLARTRDDAGRYRKWLEPLVGPKPIRGLTRRDIEEIVQALDRHVRAGDLRWKTAHNVWGVITKMMKDACRSKVIDLRVRDDNPAASVEGPDRGTERSGPYLFPSEFLALMNSDRVPARWKRIFALATYLYVRRGELAALEWADVDFDHGYVLVHRAEDEEGVVKSTKTKDTRKVPIEPTLLPLLTAMHRKRKRAKRVIALPPSCDIPKRLRTYLEWAGVKRADLFANDDTRRPLSFHDLRHSGITWRAVRGDEPLKIQRAAGHDDLNTTQKYINEAESFEGRAFGDPFPALALDQLGFGPRDFRQTFGLSASRGSRSPAKKLANAASPAGFENPPTGTPNVAERAEKSGTDATPGDASRPGLSASIGSPRARFMAAAAEAVRDASAVGDVGAARIAHTVIGALLALEPDAGTRGATVVDLAAKRAKR